jgi:hypothetical protein
MLYPPGTRVVAQPQPIGSDSPEGKAVKAFIAGERALQEVNRKKRAFGVDGGEGGADLHREKTTKSQRTRRISVTIIYSLLIITNKNAGTWGHAQKTRGGNSGSGYSKEYRCAIPRDF